MAQHKQRISHPQPQHRLKNHLEVTRLFNIHLKNQTSFLFACFQFSGAQFLTTARAFRR